MRFEAGTAKPSALARSKLHQTTRPGVRTAENAANHSGPSVASRGETPKRPTSRSRRLSTTLREANARMPRVLSQSAFSGSTTFGRLPHASALDAGACDLAILGIPFDGLV